MVKKTIKQYLTFLTRCLGQSQQNLQNLLRNPSAEIPTLSFMNFPPPMAKQLLNAAEKLKNVLLRYVPE